LTGGRQPPRESGFGSERDQVIGLQMKYLVVAGRRVSPGQPMGPLGIATIQCDHGWKPMDTGEEFSQSHFTEGESFHRAVTQNN
jgi:hypothetical protein